MNGFMDWYFELPMWAGMLVLLGAIGALIGIVIWLVWLCDPYRKQLELYGEGVVTYRQHIPASTSHGSGTVVDSSGHVGVVSTSDYSPAQYILAIEVDGIVGEFNADSQTFYKMGEGTKLAVHYRQHPTQQEIRIDSIERLP